MSRAESRRIPVKTLVASGIMVPALALLPAGDAPGRTEAVGSRAPSRGSAVVDCTTGEPVLRLNIPPDPNLIVTVPNTGVDVIVDEGKVTGVVLNPGDYEPFSATAGDGTVRVTRTDAEGEPTVVFESDPLGSEVIISGICA